MSKLTTATIAALAMALASCGSTPPAPKPVEERKPDAAYRAKFLSLTPDQRNSVLFKAIAANNGACPEVKKSAYQQDYKDMTMWVAECALTGDWAVFVNGGGYAQTRECRQLKQLGLPECRPI